MDIHLLADEFPNKTYELDLPHSTFGMRMTKYTKQQLKLESSNACRYVQKDEYK